MANGIEPFELKEGNIAAVKDTGDFGGPNMWKLYVKKTNGVWDSVQWMHVGRIQEFFKGKLPEYEENTKTKKYKKL